MNSAIERLLSLRVGDVMSENPVRLSAGATMAEAAETLQRHGVSGAPVIDDQGECVGVLTAVDFISQKIAVAGQGAEGVDVENVLVQDKPGEPYHVETLSHDVVQNYMSEDVQSISRSATIIEAARGMCAAHIHRIVVLDEANHPVGLVSSLDLVAAMVKAIEE